MNAQAPPRRKRIEREVDSRKEAARLRAHTQEAVQAASTTALPAPPATPHPDRTLLP